MAVATGSLERVPFADRVELRQAGLIGGGLATALVFGVATGAEPKLTLAAVFGVIVVYALIAEFSVGLALFIVLQFMIPALGLAEGTLVKLLGAVLVASWLLARLSNTTSISFSRSCPIVAGALVGFLLWGTVTLTWAPSHGAVINALMRYALNALLLAMVVAGVRTSKDAKRVAVALSGGAILSAMIALALSSPGGGASGDDRLSGAGGDANEFAVVLAQGLVLAVGIAGGVLAGRGRRIAFALGALVTAFALLATLSRGGLVALSSAMIAWVVFSGRWRGRAAFGTVALLVAGIFWFNAVATPTARERVASIAGSSGSQSTSGGTGRTDIWQIGWRAFSEDPITGGGLGNYIEVTPRFLLAEPGLVRRSDLIIVEPKVAHNMYLHLLVETGVIGLLLFGTALVAAIVTAVNGARRWRARGAGQLELLTRTTVAATLGVLSADFFLSGQYGRTLWLMLGFCCALGSLSKRELTVRLR